MSGAWLLSISWIRAHRVQSAILVVCLAVAVFLPGATSLLSARFESDLTARADATPLVAGAKGSRFDLVLGALYFRRSGIEPISMGAFDEIAGARLGVAVPVNASFTSQGLPLVATSYDYFDQRRLRPAEGSLPVRIGDGVLGSKAASRLGLTVGDSIYSDQRELYDISKPPAMKLTVVGVLAPSGTPDDSAVFTDISTAWVLEGLVHGHRDAATDIDDSLLIGRTDSHVAVSEALVETNSVTDENVSTFHTHASRDELPLTSVVVFPTDEKSATILKARINGEGRWQMVSARSVIDELLEFVFRIKALLDAIALVLGLSTALLVVLVISLSVRLRAGEIRTLHRIGASPFMTLKLYACELSLLIGSSVLLGVCGIVLAAIVLPDLVGIV